MEILFWNSLLSVLLIWGNYSHVHLGRHMGEKASTIRNARERCWGGLHPKNDVGATANDTLLVPFGTPKWSTINSTLSKWDYAHRILGGPMSFWITPSWGFLIASIAGGNVERKWPVLSRHDKSTGRAPTTYHTTMFRFCSLGCGLGLEPTF